MDGAGLVLHFGGLAETVVFVGDPVGGAGAVGVNLLVNQDVAGERGPLAGVHPIDPFRHLLAGGGVVALELLEQAVVGVFVVGGAIGGHGPAGTAAG